MLMKKKQIVGLKNSKTIQTAIADGIRLTTPESE